VWWCHVGTHSDFHFWGCHVNVWSIFHLILMSAITEMVQSQAVWPATECNDVTWKLSSCQKPKYQVIHSWKNGNSWLEHLNEVNIYQYECPKKWKIKAILTATGITMQLFTHTMKTNSTRENILGNDIFLTYPSLNFVYLARRSLVCCSQHSKTF